MKSAEWVEAICGLYKKVSKAIMSNSLYTRKRGEVCLSCLLSGEIIQSLFHSGDVGAEREDWARKLIALSVL